MFEQLVQDLGFGLRSLRKSPGYAALAVVTLALGIGANTAIFSVVSGVLLKPLPYDNGDRLVLLRQSAPGIGQEDLAFSIPEVMDYRERLDGFEGVVEYHSMSFTLLNRGEPDRVLTGVVSHRFFDVLGVQMLHGRSFRAEDDRLGAEAVLILSHPYWEQRFGADPDIVGQVFEMNDKPHRVVGVLPPMPQWPRDNDVYMPTVACPFRGGAQREMDTDRSAFRALTAFGLLEPGVGEERADAGVATVAAGFRSEHPDVYTEEAGFGASTVPLFDELTADARPMLMILLATSGLVLLTACANVANLMLSRVMRREREMAVRAALGAGRGRILRQMLTESTLLALIGGVLGLSVAVWGVDLLTGFVGRFTPRTQQIGVDGQVLAFTLGLSVLTGLVFGALPALSSRGDVAGSLRESGGRSTAGRSRHRLRSGLIVGQVALSFMLLVGAGLLLSSFWRLQQVDPGFDPEGVVAAEVFPNWSKYRDNESRRRLFSGILDRLEGIPAVTAAAVAQSVPLAGGGPGGQGTRFEIEGRVYENPDLRPRLVPQSVSPGYFETVGVPLLAGRGFDARDHDEAPRVAVVSQSLAASHWEGGNPVGTRIRLDGDEEWKRVVGVASDVRQFGLDAEPPEALYVPLLQQGFGGQLLVRTRGAEPASLAGQVRDAVHAIDPEQPVENFRTLEQVRSGSIATPRLTATLLGMFAGLALVITLAGITGVVATSVSERTREFGVRMALGAGRGRVLAMVLGRGVALVGVGSALGLLGALLFGRLLEGMLYATAPTDPLTYAGVVAVLLAAAVAACWIPARRATGVDPLVALRSE